MDQSRLTDEEEFKRLLFSMVDPLTCWECREFSYRVKIPRWKVAGSDAPLAPFCPDCKHRIDMLDRQVAASRLEDALLELTGRL